jgi:uncharacterized surface protein with fasciclin (FAS1) repeats
MRFATLFLTTALAAAPALAQTTPAAAPTPAPRATPAAPAASATPAAPAASATPAAPAATATPAAPAAGTPVVSGTIAAALPTIPNHATLVRLVTAAQLGAQLSGPGPFTLFAPNDTAFSRLPPGTLDTLTAPSNLAGLQTIVKNHVVAGSLTEAQIRQQIQAGGGRATIATLSGQPLTASLENNVVLLTDAIGNKSFLDKADIKASNGIIHSTNGLSLPKLG